MATNRMLYLCSKAFEQASICYCGDAGGGGEGAHLEIIQILLLEEILKKPHIYLFFVRKKNFFYNHRQGICNI